MQVYQAPLSDFRFVLEELLAESPLHELPEFNEATPDLMHSVIEEAGKFAADILLPLNITGDQQGCHYEDGTVKTPDGFKAAYDQFVQNGWSGLVGDPKHGGQGLPHTLNSAVTEIFCSANMAFTTYPSLTQGAYAAIQQFAPPDLQDIYLPKLADGSWSGVMCLTEPQCGTDLGLITTRAETIDAPDQKETYALTGTKIFISAGEHDLAHNIVYLVLARLPGAPEGIKGLSLFLVPKYLPDSGKSAAQRNSVHCARIERKMGLHGSATCTMNFDAAKGWLIGQPHRGMQAMFLMMNLARLGVAIQGVAISEIASQSAQAYAQDRRQGRALSGPVDPQAAADPIHVHPDIKRMLLTMQVHAEGGRALALKMSKALDLSTTAPDQQQRQEAADYLALMTPIAKALFTDQGSESANLCIQVHGGHGYIRDNGIEQFVRDSRVAQIYEGANGIQALDLIGRKLPTRGGRLLASFFHPLHHYIESRNDNADLAAFIGPLGKAFGRLQQATAVIAQRGLKNKEEAAVVAYDYLNLFGLTALAEVWTRSAEICLSYQSNSTMAHAEPDDAAFYQGKLARARFFMEYQLPLTGTCFNRIMSGGKSILSQE